MSSVLVAPGSTCGICGCVNWTHRVSCKNFVCTCCGKKGVSLDHEKGCPESEMLWGTPNLQVQPTLV